jgi:hypothetical protein
MLLSFWAPPRVLSTGVLKKFIQVYIMENQLYVLHARYNFLSTNRYNFLSTKNEMILNAKLYFEGQCYTLKRNTSDDK